MDRRQLKAWALGFGFYTVVAALFTVQKLLLYSSHGKPFGVHDAVLTCLGIYTWAALTPIIFYVARHHPLDGPVRGRSVVAHTLTLLVLVPIDMGVYVLLDELLRGLTWGESPPSLGARFLKLLAWGGPGDILWYAGVVAVSHATSSHEKLRQGEIRASRLENRLTRTRLQVLRTQLQPHFLFNTLHAVSALLHDDPASAKRMLSRLAHLLWLTLRNDSKQEVSLREELEMLESYLEIQQVRFADRLTVLRDIAPAALTARVPNLILQPLVENAIRHGTSRRSTPGRLEVGARLEDGWLRLEVRDNGGGLPRGAVLHEGVGLSNTRARLQQLYGSRHLFELGDAPGGGLSVVLKIPFVEGAEPVERPERDEPLAARRVPFPSSTPVSVTPPVSTTAAAAAGTVSGPATLAAPAVSGANGGELAANSTPDGAPERLVPRGWKAWTAVFAAWLLFDVLLAGQALLVAAPEGARVPPEHFYFLAYQSLVWSCFTAFILFTCERVPLGRGSLAQNLGAHGLANVALFGVGTSLLAGLDGVVHFVPWHEPIPTSFSERFARAGHTWFIDYILRYWLVVGIGHAYAFQRLARRRELEASLLEGRLAQTELELLTLKLQPHFLFETLRDIASRVDDDPRGADRMLTRLGDLLRLVLEGGGRQAVPLVQELLALEPYLKIQQARFRERLSVRRDIPPEAAEAEVPNLVLQALVDHAVRHGVARRGGASWIEIRARRRNGTLELVVEDGGAGGAAEGKVAAPDSAAELADAAAASVTPDAALEDTRTRLNQLYGSDHRLELWSSPGGGLRIDLEIPYHPAGATHFLGAGADARTKAAR